MLLLRLVCVAVLASLAGACGPSADFDAQRRAEQAPPSRGGSGGGSYVGPAPTRSRFDTVGFSVPSTTFEESLSVALETSIAGAIIHYTTDGSVPGGESPAYEGSPIEILHTLQLRAQAFNEGVAVGRGNTALYVKRTFDVTSDLPLIVIDGYGAGKPQDRTVYQDMAFMVFEPDDERDASLSSPPSLATRGGHRRRGQSSFNFEQTPYRIELWNHASEDDSHRLLGMPAGSDWVLLGPFVDRTLIRNAFAYSLGQDMGLAAPRFAFAEVYINHAGGPLEPHHYEGVYMVVETIENHPRRLNLEQLEPDDTAPEQLSGGYIFKFDWNVALEPTLRCSGSEPLHEPPPDESNARGAPEEGGTCWTDLEVVDPNPLADAQAAWLTAYVQEFHDALHESSFEQYSELMEVDSFVDVFIVNELTRNFDAYIRSTYYFKERDRPLSAGPLWDLNLTLGMGFQSGAEPTGWQYEERRRTSDWFRILGADPDFRELVSLRWRDLREGLLSEPALMQRISVLSEPLTSAAARDFERWPVSLAGTIGFVSSMDPTWEGQLQAARDWLSERLAWMDLQLSARAR